MRIVEICTGGPASPSVCQTVRRLANLQTSRRQSSSCTHKIHSENLSYTIMTFEKVMYDGVWVLYSGTHTNPRGSGQVGISMAVRCPACLTGILGPVSHRLPPTETRTNRPRARPECDRRLAGVGLDAHQSARRKSARTASIDESGLENAPLARRTWALHGCTPY